jgi:hypothetical protein
MRNTANGISVRVSLSGGTSPWNLDFSAPQNQALVPGNYATVRRYGTTIFPGLMIWRDQIFFCNYVTGRYLVRDVSYAPNGDVLRLAIDAEQHCNGINQALFAAIRYNSTVPTDIFPDSAARYSLTMARPIHGLVSGAGLSCGGTQIACSMTFTDATRVMLSAIPDTGYVFTGWTGGCSGGSPTFLWVTSVQECGATFAPTTPVSRRTLLTMDYPLGWGAWNGQHFIYGPQNSLWRVTPFGNGGLRIDITGMGPYADAVWSLEFRAPSGQTLQPGTYYSEDTAQYNGATAFVRMPPPGLEVQGDGGRCLELFGRLDVRQIEFDLQTGAVNAFAAGFEQKCLRTATIALTGTVNYRATHEIPCTAPDPFTALGDGVCYKDGWLPPGMDIPDTPIAPLPPVPPTPGTCTTSDPFASLGGGTCFNGGWLPPGMPTPGGGNNPTPPPPPPPPTGCTIPDPFVSLGGGTCRNGGWLPPGMQ